MMRNLSPVAVAILLFAATSALAGERAANPPIAAAAAVGPAVGDDFPGAEEPDSPFDKIIRHELPAARIYEDADVLAFLSNKPCVPGHAVVISKTSRARSLIAMPPEMLAKMMAVARRVMIAQRRVLGATGALILSASGSQQTIPTCTSMSFRPSQATGRPPSWRAKLR